MEQENQQAGCDTQNQAGDDQAVIRLPNTFICERPMCQRCWDHTLALFPRLQPEQAARLLMDATCFPFGDADKDLLPQLQDIARRFPDLEGDELIHAASLLAEADMTLCWLSTNDWT